METILEKVVTGVKGQGKVPKRRDVGLGSGVGVVEAMGGMGMGMGRGWRAGL